MIDYEAGSAIYESRLRARGPQVLSAQGVVCDRGKVDFVLTRAVAFAGHVNPRSVWTNNKIINRVRAASTDPIVNANPLLSSVRRVAGDRDVVDFPVGIEPRAFAPYNNQAIALIRLGRWDEAKAVLKRAQLQHFDSGRLHQRLMEIAYLEGDHPAVEKEAQWFAGKPEEYAGLATQAANEDALGRRQRARELYQRAAELARRRSLVESAAQFEEADTLADALTGTCATVRGADGPALAFALCGDAAAAQKLAARASATFPHGTLWNSVELPAIRAAIALSAHDAVEVHRHVRETH